MSLRLYLDGCSYTFGQGLPRSQSLAALFSDVGGYTVTDLSRPGKSNLAIAYDVYEHAHDHDVVVLGWTFSSRLGIKYQEQNIDFYAGSTGNGLGFQDQKLDEASVAVYKYFYTVFGYPYCDKLSDMLVDTTMHYLKDKIAVAFSWEKRDTRSQVIMPYIGHTHRLDDGHLSAEGTVVLYDLLQQALNV
jgi:hypothetical protein